jgi:hypothetical protein
VLVLALGAAVALPAVVAVGAAGAASFAEPVALGATEAQLRARFGESLSQVDVRTARPLHLRVPGRGAAGAAGEARDGGPAPTGTAESPPVPASGAMPYGDQQRLARTVSDGDVQRVEYDLHDGRVVRIRWLLAERFEQPVMDPVVSRLSERLGAPAYDQTIEGKLGSGKATLRRAGWTEAGRGLEVRQLHPQTGGPLYVTQSDLEALQAIVSEGGVVMPEPDTTQAWWRRPQSAPRLPTADEIAEGVAAVEALVRSTSFSPRRP